MDLVFTMVIGFLAAEIYALIRWRGVWRLAALLPLMITGSIIVWIVIEPARHYLLAFEMLVWSVLSLVFLGLVAGIRWLVEVVKNRRIR